MRRLDRLSATSAVYGSMSGSGGGTTTMHVPRSSLDMGRLSTLSSSAASRRDFLQPLQSSHASSSTDAFLAPLHVGSSGSSRAFASAAQVYQPYAIEAAQARRTHCYYEYKMDMITAPDRETEKEVGDRFLDCAKEAEHVLQESVERAWSKAATSSSSSSAPVDATPRFDPADSRASSSQGTPGAATTITSPIVLSPESNWFSGGFASFVGID